MTLEEFYQSVGGSYQTVLGRLRSEERIPKYLRMFLADDSYQQLCAAVEAQDWPLVFRTSHTLKGAAANLELTNLFEAASAVCENTRNGDPVLDINAQMDRVHAEYKHTIDAINEVI